jgi:hypothetical protein
VQLKKINRSSSYAETMMQESLDSAAQSLKVGRYRHYKGQYYQVLATARHSETREWMVVYRCLYGDFSIWIRPLSMFTEWVTLEQGQQVLRFAYESEMMTEFSK